MGTGGERRRRGAGGASGGCGRQVALTLGLVAGLVGAGSLGQAAAPAGRPAAVPSTTASAKSPVQPTKVSAWLRTRLAVQARRGWLPGPRLALQRATPQAALPVTLRFASPLDTAALARLEALGLTFSRRADGTPHHVGAVYAAALQPKALARLAAEPGLLRLEASQPLGPPPGYMTNNLELVGVPSVWPRLDVAGQPLDGRTMAIGDLDSSIDVFHPALFFADGGLFSWVDADGDGRFAPGRDGVDLDGDGRIGADERLQLHEGAIHYRNSQTAPWIDNDDGQFQPQLDYLYADANGNGERDFGPDAGFTEQDPSYGERLFVADDVDGDGTLDPGEKLVALGTSKLRGYYSLHQRRARRRGVDLIRTPRPASASHGTGVVGILVGNDPRYHAFSGLAPGAEVLFVDQDLENGDDSDALLLAGLDWVGSQGVQVVIHEYGTPLLQFGDGSSNLEAAIDTQSEQGLVQCAAAHNYGDSPMHAVLTVPAGGTTWLPWEAYDIPGYPTEVVYGTVRWRAPNATLTPSLRLPGNQELALPENDQLVLDDGTVIIATAGEQSARGTSMRSFYLYRVDDSGQQLLPVQPGSYSLGLHNPGRTAQPVDVFLADGSGYAMTVALQERLTASGTVAWPATADRAVTVAAYRGNFEIWDDGIAPGGLRDYSGRDPRIDGVAVLDLAAPDDSLTSMFDPAMPYGQFEFFSGTSGALPVVGASALLLRQAEPGLTPAEVTERLHDAAGRDGQTGGVPNAGWGFGRIAAYRAITGEDPPANTPPSVRLQLGGDGTARSGRPVVIDAAGCDDAQQSGDSLQLRWDVAYDGDWDTDWSLGRQHQVVFPTAGRAWVLAEVRDAGGLVGRALLPIDVEPDDQPGEDAGPPGPDGGAPADGGAVAIDAGPGAPDGGEPTADLGRTDGGATEGEGEGTAEGEGEGGGEGGGEGEGEGDEGPSAGRSGRRNAGCGGCALGPAGEAPDAPTSPWPLLGLLGGLGLVGLRRRR